MKPESHVFIYLKYRTAERPVRRYWANKPLQRLDELWEAKRYNSDREFKTELRKRLHALTFPYRFWAGDFGRGKV